MTAEMRELYSRRLRIDMPFVNCLRASILAAFPRVSSSGFISAAASLPSPRSLSVAQ